MTDLDRIAQKLRAFVNSEVFLEVQDISDAADELERLEAENRDLREMLIYYYLQNRCVCSHPACRRCVDDRFVEDILGDDLQVEQEE